MGRPVAEFLKGPGGVAVRDPALYALAGLGTGGVGAQIVILIFQAAPQALDENIITAAAFAVHADPDAGGVLHAGEGRAAKLGTLVAVEDRRSAGKGQRCLEGLATEGRINSTTRTSSPPPPA